MSNVIKIDNLSFSYASKSVLHNVSLQVDENEVVIILGPNGSGKTTFLKCLLGLLDFKQGGIWYYGKDITQYSKSDLAKTVCFVPQLSAINNNFLARDYIALACTPYLRFYESPSREVYEKIDRLAEDFSATDLLNRSMQELSGGEQQLISIIKALAQDSPVIVLDEPTSALDYGNQGKFLDYIKKLKLLGKTIIMSSHNPNHAFILKSKVCVIQNGITTYNGLADDIITKQMLKDVYNANFRILKDDQGIKSIIWDI